MRLSVRTDPKFLKTETIFQHLKFKPHPKKKKKSQQKNQRKLYKNKTKLIN